MPAIAVLLSCAPIIRGQAVPAPTALPSDPKELMLAAAHLNSLTGADMLPWHLKATFQIFDENGTVSDEGSDEEFWVNQKSSKRIFTGKAFTQTEYTTDKGDFRTTSSHGDVPLPLSSAHNDLIDPMPGEPAVEHLTFSSREIQSGTLKLICIAPAGAPNASTYCLTSGEPILRIFASPSASMQVLYNGILRFKGRAVAGDLKLTRSGKVVVELRIDALEPLDTKDESLFTPPPEAALAPAPRLVNISAAVATGMLLQKVVPEYPLAAKDAHITGTVVLEAIIDKEGHIRNLKVLSGPDALQGAAQAAVQQWRYRPYLLNGLPVEVRTNINVIFTLGR